MIPPRLLMVAAAAGILAAGCDYLNNLFTDTSITKAPLTIQVRDTYTGQAMEDVHCTDAARGLDFHTDNQGIRFFPETGTGSYSLHCEAPQWYYAGIKKFDVEVGSAKTVIVDLARRGGAEWYPEEPEKRIRILDSESSFRFPRMVKLRAYQPDTSGRFKFEWIFSGNPSLNRTFNSIRSRNPVCSLVAERGKIKAGPDTVIVNVKAEPEDLDAYLVGSDTLIIDWVPNKPPLCSAWAHKPGAFLVGCEGDKTENNAYVNIFVAGSDSDGSFETVVFESLDSTSSFGKFRKSYKWSEIRNKAGSVRFDLKSPWDREQKNTLYRTDSITVSVWDDNGEHDEMTVPIVVKSNTIPMVTAEKLTPGSKFFIGDPIQFKITGSDSETAIRDLFFEWGDGERSYLVGEGTESKKELTQILTYAYRKEEPVRPVGYAVDNCKEANNWPLDDIEILKNTPPRIVLRQNSTPFTGDPGPLLFQLKVDVEDIDVTRRLDSLTAIRISWGDGSPVQILPPRPPGKLLLDTLMTHSFPMRPTEGKYTIRVTAEDAHLYGGSQDSLTVPAAPALPEIAPSAHGR